MKSKIIFVFVIVMILATLVSSSRAYAQNGPPDTSIVMTQGDEEMCTSFGFTSCLIFEFMGESLNTRIGNLIKDLKQELKIGSQIQLIQSGSSYTYVYGCIGECGPIYDGLSEEEFRKKLSDDGLSNSKIDAIMKNLEKIKRILEEMRPKDYKSYGKIISPILLVEGKPVKGAIAFPCCDFWKGTGNKMYCRDIIEIGDFINKKDKESLIVEKYAINFSQEGFNVTNFMEDKEGLVGIKTNKGYLMIKGPHKAYALQLGYKKKFPLKASLKKDNEISVYRFEPSENNWDEPRPLIYSGEKLFNIYCGEKSGEIEEKISKSYPDRSKFISSTNACDLEIEDDCKIKGNFKLYVKKDKYGSEENKFYFGVLLGETLDVCNEEIIKKDGQKIKLRELDKTEISKLAKELSSLIMDGKTYENVNPEKNSENPVTDEVTEHKKVGDKSGKIKGENAEVDAPNNREDAKRMIEGEEVPLINPNIVYENIDRNYVKRKFEGYKLISSAGNINEANYPKVDEDYLYVVTSAVSRDMQLSKDKAQSELLIKLSEILNLDRISLTIYGMPPGKFEIYHLKKGQKEIYFTVALLKIPLESLSRVEDGEKRIEQLKEYYEK